MSAERAWNKVMAIKQEKGIPVGNLSDGTANLDDILWYTAIKAIMDEIVNESQITTSILPGTQIIASGSDATGSPVVVYGTTISFGIGGTIIS